jgi:hypothetical protein
MFAARAALMTTQSGPVASSAWALLHFDNNVTNAGTGGGWSSNISPTYSSSVVKFGSHSLLSNSNTRLYSNTSRVVPSNFTAECWFYPMNLSQVVAIFGSQANGGGYMPFGFFQVNSAIQLNLGNVAGNGWDLVQGGGTITGSAWNHLAISGNGTTVKAFLNGTQVISASQPAWTASQPITIGDYGGSYFFNGYIDEYRFDQTCHYTGNFTPPTAAFT